MHGWESVGAIRNGRFFLLRAMRWDGCRNRRGDNAVQRIPAKGLGGVQRLGRLHQAPSGSKLGTNRIGRSNSERENRTSDLSAKRTDWATMDQRFRPRWRCRCTTSARCSAFRRAHPAFVEDRELIHRFPLLADLARDGPARTLRGRLLVFRSRTPFLRCQQGRREPTRRDSAAEFPAHRVHNGVGRHSSGWETASIWFASIHTRQAPPSPPAAQITSVQLTASDRHFFTPGAPS